MTSIRLRIEYHIANGHIDIMVNCYDVVCVRLRDIEKNFNV